MAEKSVFDQSGNFINRELSWMEFNKRILGEARDKQNPLFERMKFLSINRSEAAKKEGTKEWERIYGMKDPAVAEAEHSRNP